MLHLQKVMIGVVAIVGLGFRAAQAVEKSLPVGQAGAQAGAPDMAAMMEKAKKIHDAGRTASGA